MGKLSIQRNRLVYKGGFENVVQVVQITARWWDPQAEAVLWIDSRTRRISYFGFRWPGTDPMASTSSHFITHLVAFGSRCLSPRRQLPESPDSLLAAYHLVFQLKVSSHEGVTFLY